MNGIKTDDRVSVYPFNVGNLERQNHTSSIWALSLANLHSNGNARSKDLTTFCTRRRWPAAVIRGRGVAAA
jgi:hypothetical protein